MTAWTLPEQRRINLALRTLHHRYKASFEALVAVACLVLIINPSIDHHQGSFGSDFNQDFDVSTWNLKMRFGIEVRAGGGSLNFVNKKWGIGRELLSFK